MIFQIHNLTGYDAHIICQAIGIKNMKTPEIIARNLEEYVFFQIGKQVMVTENSNSMSNRKLVEQRKTTFCKRKGISQKTFPKHFQ